MGRVRNGTDTHSTCVLSAVHPLADVRRRAVQALDFKVKHGLVDIADVIKASAQGI